MPPDENEDDSEQAASETQTASGPLPLSRNASRALVIGSILFVIAASAGGAWLILSLARGGPPPQETAPPPADTTDTMVSPPAP